MNEAKEYVEALDRAVDWTRAVGCGCKRCSQHNADIATLQRLRDTIANGPTEAMLDRAVAFALQVQISKDYGWTQYMRDLWGRFVSAIPSDTKGAR